MGSLKLSLDLKHDMWTYFVSYLVKWKYWDDPCCENEILVYRLLSLRNKKVGLVPLFKTWYVNIFCIVFGKMKILECSLSRKCDFSLYGKFYKQEGWMCPLILNMICEHIWFCIRQNESIGMTLVADMWFWPIYLQVWEIRKLTFPLI